MNVKCPQCGEKSTVPAEYAGRSVTCPGCHWAMLIPVAAEIESRRPLASALLVLVGAVIGLTLSVVLWMAMDPAARQAASLSSELAATEARIAETETRAAAAEADVEKSKELLELAAKRLASVSDDASPPGFDGMKQVLVDAGWKGEPEQGDGATSLAHSSGAKAIFNVDAMGTPFASLLIDGTSAKQGDAKTVWWIALLACIDEVGEDGFMANARRVDAWENNPRSRIIMLKGAVVTTYVETDLNPPVAVFTAYFPE